MKLSIITINYNDAAGLKKTLDSVAMQTCADFEHIIVDGASTDDSVDIIRAYSQSPNRYQIRWISEPDKGIYDAMNKGIALAEGDYCLFLNSGDILYGDNALLVLMQNNPSADVVSCNAIYEKSQFHDERFIISPLEIRSSDIILNYLPHQATLIRRSLFSIIHNYDTSFKVVSDWLFFIEALLVYGATYEHVHMFLSQCESEGISNNPENNKIMDEEFHRGLRKVLPLYYKDYVELRNERRSRNNEKQRFAEKLISSKFGMLLWKLRKYMGRLGYYKWKKKRTNQRFLKQLVREDNLFKENIRKEIEILPVNLLKRNNDGTDIIVSLTSYGNRVHSSVAYAIYSIFTQSYLPNRIVLWLDKDHWNDNNLPYLLQRLQKSGLEIYYCEDIRSYKKLIPSLKMFPNNPIVVIDDDFYYNHDFVKWMVEAYENSDKRTVFATWGCLPIKEKGQYLPYSQWKDCKYGNKNSEFSLFGGGSIYPPNVFDEEMFREDLFMKLCPTADDIWFWAQEKRLGLNVKVTDINGYGLHRPINRIEAYEGAQENTLYYTNCIHGANNVQLENVLKYYNL